MEWISKYWIEVLFGLITTAVGFVVKYYYGKVKKLISDLMTDQAEQRSIKTGVTVLLGDRIIQLYAFHSKNHYCSLDSMREITILYNHYTELGGDDEVVKSLFNNIMSLPHNTPEESDDNV